MKLPSIGFGTASLKGDICTTAVKAAIDIGYRMIDTALLYGNQVEVGQAIKECNVNRDELWITSKVGFFPPVADSNDKLWMYNDNNLKGQEDLSIDLSLQQMGLDYIDLMLIHNPCASPAEYNAATLPHFFEYFNLYYPEKSFSPAHYADGESIRDALILHKLNKIPTDVSYEETYALRKRSWQNLEKAQKDGKCKYIGVSNYPVELLEEMMSYATVMPQFNQLEFHPRFASPKLRDTANRLGVKLIGYGCSSAMKIEVPAAVAEVASKTGLSNVEVCQCWMKSFDIVPLVRSKDPSHIAENFRVLDKEPLTSNDIERINTEHRDYPYYWDPRATRLTIKK